MDYPKWAPPDLVEDHQRHLKALQAGPLTASETGDLGIQLEPECPHCGCLKCQCVTNGDALSIFEDAMRYEFSQTKAREPILRRMICNEPMDIFWAWAEKQNLQDERRRDGLPFVIWHQLKVHLMQFEKYPERTNTEKKKSLNRIRKAAEELHAAILADDDAECYAASAMSSAMMDMNLRYRREVLELPPPSADWEYEGPADSLEANCVLSGGYRFTEDGIQVGRHPRDGDQEQFPLYVYKAPDSEELSCLPWREQPIEQRLSWWRIETEKISLLELLNYFCNGIRSERERPSPVKQRREDGGKRAYFIRAAASILTYHFHTAPPERVADLAGAILDETLGRDDVRPYLR